MFPQFELTGAARSGVFRLHSWIEFAATVKTVLQICAHDKSILLW
jgi:hypothetical protein